MRVSIVAVLVLVLVLSSTADAQTKKKKQQQQKAPVPEASGDVDLSANFDHKGFIRVQNGKFVDEDCREYHFTGWNAWGLVDTAAFLLQLPPEATEVQEGKNPIVWMFDEAVKAGLGVLRMFGHAAVPQLSLQMSPGLYREETFKGLDYVIAEAGKRGIKLIISFSTNWKFVDGLPQYVAWAKRVETKDDFWISPEMKAFYKNHMEAIATRENTFNGLKYRDDPTVFAWNIFNELRCQKLYCEEAALQWFQEMATHLRSVDPNHMITIGEEGFYAWGCPNGDNVNPLPASHRFGQDFIRDHSIPEIDFAAIHLWPNNWDVNEDLEFPIKWIRQHAKDSQDFIKKPLVVEEFGIITADDDTERKEIRDPFFTKILKEVESSLDEDYVLRGALFWEWHINLDKPVRKHGVVVGDSTWKIITEHAEGIARRNAVRTPIKSCKPGKGSTKVKSVDPNNRYNVEGCCDTDCQAHWADLKGDVYQESITASASDCCRACKFANVRARTFVCTHWSWCSCSSCGESPEGTCRLKSQKNPFYPRAWIRGNGQPWVSGVAGKFAPEWSCQPSGKCAYDPDCQDFGKSLKCVDANVCGAGQFEFGVSSAETLVGSVNSQINRPFGKKNLPPVLTAAECCSECRKTEGCNAWRFCFNEKGCPLYKKECPRDKEALGISEFEECGEDGLFPRFMCSLFTGIDLNEKNAAYGESSDWVFGVLPSRRGAK